VLLFAIGMTVTVAPLTSTAMGAAPGEAYIAVQFVLNYEEGAESCVLDGDAGSEVFLSEIVNAPLPEIPEAPVPELDEAAIPPVPEGAIPPVPEAAPAPESTTPGTVAPGTVGTPPADGQETPNGRRP